MEINMNKIYIVGMGPGFESMMTKQAIDALDANLRKRPKNHCESICGRKNDTD
jgi:hypothetical protein